MLDDSQPRAIKLARAIRSNIGLRAYVLEVQTLIQLGGSQGLA